MNEEGRAMRRSIIAAAVAAVLLTGWAMPATAQQNGVVIQNNGVDSSDSAAGADNVHISNSPGSGRSASGGGQNNSTGPARDRDRTDRGARNTAEAAPVEEYAAAGDGYVPPAEGDFLPAPAVDESVDSSSGQVLKLPSTGSGIESSMPLAAAAGLSALALGATSLRRRRLI